MSQNKINVLSLFDGVSSGHIALERAGIAINKYYASEIDKYAIEVSKAMFPDIIQVGDVCELDFNNYKNIDMLIGGSPCFVANTLVLTKQGLVPIQHVEVGDEVLTHKRNWKKVLRVGSKLSTKIRTLQGDGFDNLVCTDNHPFYTRGINKDFTLGLPYWLASKDIIPTEQALSTTYGTYKRKTLGKWTKLGEKLDVLFDFSCDILGALYSETQQSKRAFLDAIMKKNAIWYKNEQIITIKSKYLVYAIKMLMVECYKKIPNIYYKNGTWKLSLHKKTEKYKTNDKIYWGSCYNNTKTRKLCRVYNLEVEDDNSYTADTMIVHNCQDLSIAKQNREGLHGERSKLFWKYVEALETIKPKYFLLENVASMKNDDRDAITKTLQKIYPDVELHKINAALVSAQQRKRYYWTNIKGVIQPEDKGILLKHILESGNSFNEKSYCIDANYAKGANLKTVLEKAKRTQIAEPVPCALRTYPRTKTNNEPRVKRPEIKKDGKANSITSVQSDSMVMEPVIYQLGRGYNPGGIKKDKVPTLTANGSWEHNNKIVESISSNNKQGQRIYSVREGLVCLSANESGKLYKIDLPDGDYIIRKLTPRECCRLQTYDERVFDLGLKTSNTQFYKQFGNGWCVDVVAHIFSFIE